MSILGFLGLGRAQRPASEIETETVRRIVEQLDGLPADRARFLAAFAYLLGRVARADMRIDSEEARAMERLVAERGGLPVAQAVLVVQIARNQNQLFGGTESYLVSREFNQLADRDQKLSLLECLFVVSAADRSITTAEDNVIRQIANELRLEHRDFIAARAHFREYLAVLRPTEAGSGPQETDDDDGEST